MQFKIELILVAKLSNCQLDEGIQCCSWFLFSEQGNGNKQSGCRVYTKSDQ
jgi:hypothetical protein